MNTTDNDLTNRIKPNAQIDATQDEALEFANEPTAKKIKTTILYSDLTDDTPLTKSTISQQHAQNITTTDTYKIISEQFADTPVRSESIHSMSEPQPVKASTPKTSENTTIIDTDLDSHLTNDRDVSATLHKEPKMASMTDDNILQQSNQLKLTQDDRLENDKTATGLAVEHMDVVLKQWYFTLQWQRTSMPKAGLYNKFKKRTQLLDLDLSCLLCNRYGEVIETVWFKNVRDKAESVRHRGDELLGKKPFSALEDATENPYGRATTTINDAKMNQESMVIFLSKLPPQVFHVVMVVSSYHGYPLAKAKDALCQLSDDEGNLISELAFAKLPSDTKALWFASLTRSADSWHYNTEHQSLANNEMALIQKEVSENLVRTAR